MKIHSDHFKLKKNQDPTELFDHFAEMNTQYRIETPVEKKLIALALEKLLGKYVNAFSTLSVKGNVDVETFEIRSNLSTELIRASLMKIMIARMKLIWSLWMKVI
jgi:hypothetical protein